MLLEGSREMGFLLLAITSLEAYDSRAAIPGTLDGLALHGVPRNLIVSRGVYGWQLIVRGLVLLEDIYLAPN